MTIPNESQWMNVAKRLASEARRRHQKAAVLTIRVLVDCNGNPIHWTAPDVVEIEPAGACDDLIALLTGSG